MPTGREHLRFGWIVPPGEAGDEPPVLDLQVPSMARLYNYALGGKDNLPIDREAYEGILKVFPECRRSARANRRFRDRAVRHMAEQGIEQFLDLGAGLPFRPHLHEVADEVNPDSRVVYVDNDAMVASHARAYLATRPGLEAELLDITSVESVLRSQAVSSTLDLSRPLGLVCTAVLHFAPLACGIDVLARYRSALSPGSMVAVSAFADYPERGEWLDASGLDAVSDKWDVKVAATRTFVHAWTPERMHDLFDGFEIEPPGIVAYDDWPTPSGESYLYGLAGVGRLPA